MIHALGYSHDEFKATSPGRLCRGRERWIEPWELESAHAIHRLVITGAAFTDDSARDAVRGINHSNVTVANIINALFAKKTFYAFMEDGHPADIPEDADQLEVYVGYRAGGQQSEPMVRWRQHLKGVTLLRAILGDDHDKDMVRGFAVLTGDEDEQMVSDALYELTAMSTVDSPPARFQPGALESVLEIVPVLVLLHRDKHGPALGIYSREPVVTDGKLAPLCKKTETLLVPFAIPPMLARWDRALAEMKAKWETECEEPFPVPESGEPSRWDSRGRRRNRKRSRGKKKTQGSTGGDAATDATEAVAPTPDAAPKSDPEPVVTE